MTATVGAGTRTFAPGELVAGVDVGGTKVTALVVDEAGEVRGQATMPMAGRSDGGVEPIIGAVVAALDAAGATASSLGAIGIGVPGRIDVDAGVVGLATNLGWRDLPLARLIEDQLGVPCSVENDVGLAASGLAGHPVAGGARSLAYVAIGTGIGAGLVLNGQLHRGDRGMAGEIGHVIVEPGGADCRCGQRGCLETVASGPHIARRAIAALAAAGPLATNDGDGHDANPGLRGAAAITARTVYQSAAAGEPIAVAVADETGRHLARAVAALILTCDLDLVLLGGGVTSAGSAFLDPVEAELERLRAASPLIAALIPQGAVRALPAAFEAVAWGGVALARRHARSTRESAMEEVVARTPSA